MAADKMGSGLLDLADMPARQSNPELQKTAGSNARWYIRPVVWVRDAAGEVFQTQRRYYLGPTKVMTRKEAEAERARILAMVNDPGQISKRSVFTFEEVVQVYRQNFLDAGPDFISESTRRKYDSLLRVHILPAFGPMELGAISRREVTAWLRLKTEVSWAMRSDLRNLLASIIGKASKWGMWAGENPAAGVEIGRRRAARERRKLSAADMQALLGALRPDVKLLCLLLLSTTLRISEAMGLRWNSINRDTGVAKVSQRFYRGDVDDVKTQRSAREVPLGRLAALLPRPDGAADDDFVFRFETVKGETRDDRILRRYMLNPVAKKLGLYYPGFGFHAFRRESITGLAAAGDVLLAQLLAGHSKADMTLHYGLLDMPRAHAAVEGLQDRVMGKPDEGEKKRRRDRV